MLADAKDDRVDGCYSRAEFRDALSRARDDQRLYANAVDIINEAAISHVTIPGQPCGSGRTVPPSAVPVASSGAATLWGAVALLVSVGAIGAGTLAHRRGASGPGR